MLGWLSGEPLVGILTTITFFTSFIIGRYIRTGLPKIKCSFITRIGIAFVAILFVVACDIEKVTLMFAFVFFFLALRGKLKKLRYPALFAFLIAIFHPFTYGSSPILKLPFLTIYREGISFGLLIFLRVLTSTSILIILIPSTSNILVLRKIMPEVVILLTMLMLRFIPVITDESSRTYAAQCSRYAYSGGFFRKMKDYGTLGGIVVLRSLARSEAIYESMKSRGY